MKKKTAALTIAVGVILFLTICTAESLIALRKALKERDAAASARPEGTAAAE